MQKSRRSESGAGLRKRLYDAAFEYKRGKLWKKLWDSELFSVRLSDGKIGYVCVMGKAGTLNAVALYVGDEGIGSLRKMASSDEVSRMCDRQELMLSQDCLMCSFETMDMLRDSERKELRAYCQENGVALRGKNACPHFERYRPCCIPWTMAGERDQRHLLEALEACMDVVERLKTETPESLGILSTPDFTGDVPLLERTDGGYAWGRTTLPSPHPVTYPEGKIAGATAKRVLRRKKRGGEWSVDIFVAPEAVSDEAQGDELVTEPVEAPYFPLMMFATDMRTGELMGYTMARREEYVERFSEYFGQLLVDVGRPDRLVVCNERAERFCRGIAGQVNVKVEGRDLIPELEEAIAGLYGSAGASGYDDYGDYGDFDDVPVGHGDFVVYDGGHDGFGDNGTDQGFGDMIAMLSDPAMIQAVPDDLLQELHDMAEMTGAFPPVVVANVKRELNARGL